MNNQRFTRPVPTQLNDLLRCERRAKAYFETVQCARHVVEASFAEFQADIALDGEAFSVQIFRARRRRSRQEYAVAVFRSKSKKRHTRTALMDPFGDVWLMIDEEGRAFLSDNKYARTFRMIVCEHFAKPSEQMTGTFRRAA